MVERTGFVAGRYAARHGQYNTYDSSQWAAWKAWQEIRLDLLWLSTVGNAQGGGKCKKRRETHEGARKARERLDKYDGGVYMSVG